MNVQIKVKKERYKVMRFEGFEGMIYYIGIYKCFRFDEKNDKCYVLEGSPLDWVPFDHKFDDHKRSGLILDVFSKLLA